MVRPQAVETAGHTMGIGMTIEGLLGARYEHSQSIDIDHIDTETCLVAGLFSHCPSPASGSLISPKASKFLSGCRYASV